MTIYLVLILFLFVVSFLSRGKDVSNRNKIITISSFLFIYLICIVRDYSVGVDIPAYKEAYEMSSGYEWFDASWIYMEPGYVFLMKVISSLGLSFRMFMSVAYLLLVVPISIYIIKYSKDPSLSIIIFICFTFFVFVLSALRQTLAFSFCLMAFLVATRKGKKSLLLYCCLLLIAFSMHKSAIVFLPTYYLMRKRLNFKRIVLYVLLGFVASIWKPIIIQYFQSNEISKYGIDQNLTAGSSLVFIIVIIIISWLLSRKSNSIGQVYEIDKETINIDLLNYSNLLAFSALVQIAFSGTILMRAAMFYQINILIVLPNMLILMHPKVRPIARCIIILLMLAVFYFTVLVPKQFDIVPFKFANDLFL